MDVLLINGVSLPYHVLDKGLERANISGNPVKAVFIYEHNGDDENLAAQLEEEMSKADFTDTNAERNLVDLVHHNAAFARTYFARRNIELDAEILTNPTMDDIVAVVEQANKVFLDPETFRHPDESAYVKFDYREFDERLSDKLEWCHSPQH